MEQEEQPIRTYSIEYSKQHYSKCTRCLKAIPKRSLRVATLVRKSKKEKKSKGTHQWSHFTCWKVPEELTKRPIEIFRGYPDLKEKDQIRVKKLINGGTGMTWKELQRQLVKKMEDEKAAKEEEKEASNHHHHYYNEEEEKEEEKKVNNHQHFYDEDEEEEQQQLQKEEVTKNKKNKKRKNMEDEEDDIDMTSKLTGIQTTLPLSDKKQKQKQKQKKTKTNNNNNNNNNNNKKVNKKNQPKAQEQEQKPSIKLSNSKDQIELESIAKEIQSTLLSK